MSSNRKNTNKTDKRNIKFGNKGKRGIGSVGEANKTTSDTTEEILDSSISNSEKEVTIEKDENELNNNQSSSNNKKVEPEEDKSQENGNKETKIYKNLKEFLPIATSLLPVILFFIKQIFISEKVSYYGIPSIYFNDIDLSSFLIFLLASVLITFILFYPTYRSKLIKDPQNKISDKFVVGISIVIYFVFIFSIYIGLKNIFISHGSGILIAFFIIIFIAIFIYFVKLIKKRDHINIKISLALIFSSVIYFIIVALKMWCYNIKINDIVISIISIVISIIIGDIVKSIIKEVDDNYNKYNKENINILKNLYEDISTFISLVLIFIFVLNMDLYPQFKREYEIINKGSNQCEAIITHYDGKGVVLSADIINNDQLILYISDYKLIDIENRNISVFNSKKPPVLREKRIIEKENTVVDFINLRSVMFANRESSVRLVDNDVNIYNLDLNNK